MRMSWNVAATQTACTSPVSERTVNISQATVQRVFLKRVFLRIAVPCGVTWLVLAAVATLTNRFGRTPISLAEVTFLALAEILVVEWFTPWLKSKQ